MEGVSDSKAVLQNIFHRPSIVADIPQTGDTGDTGDHPRNLENGCTIFALKPDIGGQIRGVAPENERGAQVHPDAFSGRKCGYLA